MQFTRRNLGSVAIGLASAGVLANSVETALANGEVDAVNKAVQALRTAMLAADEKALKELLSDNVVYVHSSGKLDTKAEFLSIVGGKKTVYKSINIDDNKTEVTGSSAVVRHTFSGEAETDGKVNAFKVGVLQVWQKQDGAWRLYAPLRASGLQAGVIHVNSGRTSPPVPHSKDAAATALRSAATFSR